MDDYVEIRDAERNLRCRCCDKTVNKGEKVLHTYTRACRGHHVYLCLSCIELIGNLYLESLNNGGNAIHKF